MTSLYSDKHRALQEAFGSRPLADFLDAHHVRDDLSEADQAFVASRDFFFLSTVDPDGMPSVSYKGGSRGLVRVLDARTIAFPGFDGNGMFLSFGNLEGQGKVGLLFIDFETPHRLRAQGFATLSVDDPLKSQWPGAQCVVRVALDKTWVNCPRYIHRHQRVETSRYVPAEDGSAPLAEWKRLEFVQEALPEGDRRAAEREGLLDLPAYEAKVANGEA